jgi:hypothetical protein
MLKYHTTELIPVFKKYKFIFVAFLIFGFNIIYSSSIMGLIPTIGIFLFLLFEKNIMKIKELEKYSKKDLLITSIIYGLMTGVFFLLITYIYLLTK